MTTIQFTCPQCSKALKTDAGQAGKSVRCPGCSHQFPVPNPTPAPVTPILVEAVAPPRTKKCRFCGEDIAVAATKCRHCGEWLQRPPGMPALQAGIKVVSPANAVIFTIITLGIYQIFWLHRVVKELHARGSTQTTPGKAVGFLFIPFFNFVWIFIVWKEIGDAVAREYTNARLPVPATGLVWLAPIGTLIGVFLNLAAPPAGSVIILILLPISLANVQSWLNQLSNVPVGAFHQGTSPVPGLGRQTKPCPTCGEHIPLDALLCRYCSHRFSEKDVAVLNDQQEEFAAQTASLLMRRSLSSRKTLLQVFGWILTVVGGLFLLLCVIALITGPTDPAKTSEHTVAFIAVMIIFCFPPIVIGLLLLFFAKKAQKQLLEVSD